MYNVPLIYRIKQGGETISISRLRRALRSLAIKHSTLRTALYFDINAVVRQKYIDYGDICNDQEQCSVSVVNFDEHHDNFEAVSGTLSDSPLFDLAKGRVMHCHIFRRKPLESSNEDLLISHDIVLFNFHHSMFDGASASIFIPQLQLAYAADQRFTSDEDVFQYIDYSVHETQMDMTLSQQFWRTHLDKYDFEHLLAFPFDRRRLVGDQRSGQAFVTEIPIDEDLSQSFFTYASSHQMTPFQLGLAVYYIFLFKLCNGEEDICVTCINANRYRAELHDLIGMFVATLPYRAQLDPTYSFQLFVKDVRNRCLSILEHSQYPLQHILSDAGKQQSTSTFLENVFDFITMASGSERLTLDGAVLEKISWSEADNIAKFDFMFTFLHNPTKANGSLSCSVSCSRDLFDQPTVETLGERFLVLMKQLFDPSCAVRRAESIYSLSIILPQELSLLEKLNNKHNETENAACSTVKQLFCETAERKQQKVAVELDEQSITYDELLFYTQRLAICLMEEYDVKVGDIVCQCVERSISMVKEKNCFFLV
jgi:fengycin family lipopeptide synthetase D